MTNTLMLFGIWLGPILSPALRAAVVRLMSRKVPGHGWLLYCVVVPTRWLTLTPHDADHQMQSHRHRQTPEFDIVREISLRVPCQIRTQNK